MREEEVLRAGLGDLEVFHAQVWGIAPQSVESHRDFANGRKLQLPLLSDPGNTVAKSFGVVGAFGLRRSVFVVDADGQVAWRWVSALNVTFPGVDAIGAALQELGTAA
ncbi:MAG: redoxin domain-containing protein [Actinomycetes bacterium]